MCKLSYSFTRNMQQANISEHQPTSANSRQILNRVSQGKNRYRGFCEELQYAVVSLPRLFHDSYHVKRSYVPKCRRFCWEISKCKISSLRTICHHTVIEDTVVLRGDAKNLHGTVMDPAQRLFEQSKDLMNDWNTAKYASPDPT